MSRVVEQYYALSAKLGIPVSVILVNDGSTRGISQQDIATLEEKIPSFQLVENHANRGKGYTLRKGVSIATTSVIIYTDIDFPYASDSIADIYTALQDPDIDIAIGVKDEQYYARVPLARRYISKVLRLLTAILFSLPVTDTQCGLKGFKAEAKDVFLSTSINRYLFDLEFIRNAHKQRFRIKAIPVRLNDNVVFSSMNYKLLISEAMNFLKLVVRRK
ncbi:MAG: glycosyltransferase [Chitinophagaceae bacterium]|nr:glycosyltransferase [Chitinophagaceae bacterium]